MASISQVFLALLYPWFFLLYSLAHIPLTILHLIRTHTLLATLRHPSSFQSAWFGTFWATVGPGIRTVAEEHVIPLLEGSVVAGKVVQSDGVDGQQRGVYGTILEVGPGSGMWVPLFARLHSSSGGGRITRIYGVEPNPDVRPTLKQNVAAAGLQDIYEVVPLGVEDLAASGRVAKESVDCIVSVMCLCGIPDPEFNIKEMYGYLKPGGRWFVYEHVKCGSERIRERGLFMRAYQRLVNIFWPRLVGGCELCRNTPKMLKEAGSWTKIDLEQPGSEPWYHPLPHILGTLTK
ncbi:hypothetical protein VSDG_07409 [Cytospora chrysosperma]|uniref:Methyltransferase type 11 domain-containing protein n=1 Tax=Cytospora chrysosperma TaxID=252740 RepID=A0A423VI25_CYTCH|nr:hypothetical protein VSDG_07409 [Valsa sordida]